MQHRQQHQQQRSAIDLTAEAGDGSRPGSPVLLHSVSSGRFLGSIFDGGILPELLPLLPQQVGASAWAQKTSAV